MLNVGFCYLLICTILRFFVGLSFGFPCRFVCWLLYGGYDCNGWWLLVVCVFGCLVDCLVTWVCGWFGLFFLAIVVLCLVLVS